MAVVTTFLVNLLCSFVSCDVPLPGPEIAVENNNAIISSASSINQYTDAAREEFQFFPFVRTRYGDLEGYVMRSIGNRKIYAFEGIPYATPPLGRWRFKSAESLAPWKGKRDAKKPGAPCLQLNLPRILRVIGSEDCLYLNVYTTRLPFTKDGEANNLPSLPVIFNIHGGSFYFGAGHELGPSYLLNKDLILVTINYRLGVLGFLSTGDLHSPGNYGLKDQAAALKWVFENIAAFGGDNRRITVLGHSSGAACAHLHLMSNQSNKYFRSGVSISGSALTHWAVKSREESLRLSKSLAKHVRCPSNSSESMMKCLKQKNPVELVAAQYNLLEFSPFPITLFSPVIEQPSPQAFLVESPIALYSKNAVVGKPWIFSIVAQEGYLGLLLLQSVVGEGKLRSQWSELAPIYLDYKHTATNVSQVTEKLTKFYFGHKTPKNVPENKLAAIFGDRLMLPGINKAVQLHSRIAPTDTFAYIFGFKGKYSSLGRMIGRTSDWGVGHSEDLYYFFNSSTYSLGFKQKDSEELTMSNLMTTFLENFATSGVPFLPKETDTDELSRIWEPVNPNNIRFLQLNRDIKMIPQPFKKRLLFWERLGQIEPLILRVN